MLDFPISWLQFPLLKLSSMTPIERERSDPGIDLSRSQSASQLSGWKRWQGNLVSNKLKKRLENSQFYLGPSHWGFSLSRELKVKLIVLFLILFLLFLVSCIHSTVPSRVPFQLYHSFCSRMSSGELLFTQSYVIKRKIWTQDLNPKHLKLSAISSICRMIQNIVKKNLVSSFLISVHCTVVGMIWTTQVPIKC